MIYLGSSRGMERRLVPAAGVPSFFMPMAPPFTLRGAVLTPLAIARSLVVLLRTRTTVVFATGGYVSTAAVVAGWMLRKPVIEKRVIRIKKLHDAAIILDDVADKTLGFFAHRLPQRFVKAGK